MWRNKVMIDFVKWLKEWNDKQTDQTTKVGFYGLDLYSFYESAQSVGNAKVFNDPNLLQLSLNYRKSRISFFMTI
jgi:erythromycin esterase-like protein